MRENQARFWAWFIVFGWVGPVCIYAGLKQDDLSLFIGGIIITIFFWFFIPGFDLLKNYFR